MHIRVTVTCIVRDEWKKAIVTVLIVMRIIYWVNVQWYTWMIRSNGGLRSLSSINTLLHITLDRFSLLLAKEEIARVNALPRHTAFLPSTKISFVTPRCTRVWRDATIWGDIRYSKLVKCTTNSFVLNDVFVKHIKAWCAMFTHLSIRFTGLKSRYC